MSDIKIITDISAPELDVYARLTGPQLRAGIEEGRGIFIAESTTVVSVAMAAGIKPISLLTDEGLLGSESVCELISRCENIPIYAAPEEVLRGITGFALTRGVLCAMERPKPRSARELLSSAHRVAVLESVTDATNIGALFRSAAALNIDAVLITPNCCDPLCRRAVRVSMGTVFQVPFATVCETEAQWQQSGSDILRECGFKTCALALSDNSIPIDSPLLRAEDKLALILGTEGTGLAKKTVASSDYTVKIPMSHGVDSLNVACAGAVAFWEIGKRDKNI